jgi:hypothetical protein
MSERDQIPPATADHRPDAAGASADTGTAAAVETAPEYSSRPMAFRRPDSLAGLLLLLAGVAAGISLLLRWLADDDVTGLTLVQDGFGYVGDGVGEVVRNGYVQPLTIVLGGGALLVLGLLALVPARSHRFLGVLALAASLLVAAAVLVPLALAGWDLGFFGVGFWFAIAVAVLGLLGAAKALVTGPSYGTQ